MASPIALRILGTEYVDFKSARVTYGIEAFARSFSFQFSDKWLRTLVRPLPFKAGDQCEVTVNGETVLTGHVDAVPMAYDATSHEIEITGRSANGHMVDASAVHVAGKWKQQPLLKICTDIAAPFGVAVKVDPWVAGDIAEPFAKYAIEDEETAYACMQRAAERRGVFLTSDAGLTTTITKSSPIVLPGVLKLGVNVLRARREERYTERFSEYIVKSQRAGSDTFFGPQVTGPFVRIPDTGVTAYRPLIMVADGIATQTAMLRRASWERNVRAGRSRRLEYDLQGFRSPTSTAWPINQLITVDDPYFDQLGTVLISAVSMSYGPAGSITTLELSDPAAFDVLIPPAKKSKRKGGFLSLTS